MTKSCFLMAFETERNVLFYIVISLNEGTVFSGRGLYYKSRVMRKQAVWICENKDADQLRTDQRLFRYTDSTIPLLSKFKIPSLQLSSVAVQHGLCQTR